MIILIGITLIIVSSALIVTCFKVWTADQDDLRHLQSRAGSTWDTIVGRVAKKTRDYDDGVVAAGGGIKRIRSKNKKVWVPSGKISDDAIDWLLSD